MKQWTGLCKLGLSLGKTEFLFDVQLYARRRSIECPVGSIILSVYNQHVGTESTVQLPPLWAL